MKMERMKYEHHKFALSLTIFLVSIIGIALGVQIQKASAGIDGLLVMVFGFCIVLLVAVFIILSILLRFRDELHDIHESLRTHISSEIKAHSTTGRKK